MPASQQLSMPQLYDVICHALALGDSTLQIWTSFTFAVIVAVHLAGDRIARSTYFLGSSLYAVLASVLILLILMVGGTIGTLWYARSSRRKALT